MPFNTFRAGELETIENNQLSRPVEVPLANILSWSCIAFCLLGLVSMVAETVVAGTHDLALFFFLIALLLKNGEVTVLRKEHD